MPDGILNVDKPAGWTSFDVVNVIRKRTGVKRVGHAGTLDPAATGVLPVLLGQATRLTEYLVDTTKTYRATIHLGVETDTYDAEGEVVARADASGISQSEIEGVLIAFLGEIEQTPPAYSAIKRQGVPLYKLARRGEVVEVEARRLRVDRLDITAFETPMLEVEIECSKGFYVRSLAHDIGAKLGVGGSLAGLVRTRVGSFRIDDSVGIDELIAEVESGAWQQRLYAPDEVLLHWRAAILGEANTLRLSRGQTLTLEGALAAGGELCRAYGVDGDFLAVIAAGESSWRPEKVFVAK